MDGSLTRNLAIRLAMRLILVATLAGVGAPTAGCGGAPGDGPDADDDTVDAAGGGDAAGTDDRLDPIALDRSWTYQVISTYASCPGGERDQRVTGTGEVDGRATFVVAGFCGLSGQVSVAGDRVDQYYDWGPTGWYRMLDEPVVDGGTWTTTNGSATFTQTYAELGDYAGRAGCWKVIQNVSYTSYWIYCRGVGLVKYEMVDLAGGTIRADLLHTNF